MEYEIGNPSDMCFVYADDPKVACACILFLGNGQYFCIETSTQKQIPGTFFAFGGDVEETWKQFFGVGLEEFISRKENKIKMAECYESFKYSNERTSMNNIWKLAKEYAIKMREQAEATP